MKRSPSPTAAVRIFGIAAVLVTLTACAKDYPSYGVVLWSKSESSIPTGALVGIVQKSQIQGTAQSVPLDKGKAAGPAQAIETWRLAEFPSQGEAEKYLQAQADWLRQMGVSTRLGLPVRAKADKGADITYRLRVGETVKILNRSEKQLSDGSNDVFWYLVMTKDGSQGWAAGSSLNLFSMGEAVSLTDKSGKFSPADILANLNTTVWRPESFPQMVQNDRYDLNEFAVEYGFFIDTISKTLRITTSKLTYEGAWTGIVPAADNGFLFEGVKVTGRFVDQIKLEVTFVSDNTEQKLTFVPFKQELQSIIGNELARRQAALRTLSFGGAELTSDQAGSLRIRGSTIDWNGSPAVPPGGANPGKIVQDVYISGALANAYQGAFGIQFTGATQIAYFAYSVQTNGLRLLPLSPDGLKDLAFDTVPAGQALEFLRR